MAVGLESKNRKYVFDNENAQYMLNIKINWCTTYMTLTCFEKVKNHPATNKRADNYYTCSH